MIETCIQYSQGPIMQFSESTDGYQEIMAGVKAGTVSLITGRAWRLAFGKKGERIEVMSSDEIFLRDYLRRNTLINPKIEDCWYYIKAVRQNRTGLPILDMVAS